MKICLQKVKVPFQCPQYALRYLQCMLGHWCWALQWKFPHCFESMQPRSQADSKQRVSSWLFIKDSKGYLSCKSSFIVYDQQPISKTPQLSSSISLWACFFTFLCFSWLNLNKSLHLPLPMPKFSQKFSETNEWKWSLTFTSFHATELHVTPVSSSCWVQSSVSNGTGQCNFSGQRDRSFIIVPGQRGNGTS